VAGVVMLIGMFGPWVRSGSNDRGSFEMVDLVERLGFARSGPVGLALRTWPMAPLLVVVAIVSSWWAGSRLLPSWIAAVVALVAGSTVGGVGAAVWSATPTSLIEIRWGAWVTMVGGVAMALAGVAGLLASAGKSLRSNAQEDSGVPGPARHEDLP
jgi:hypothetical protein